MIRDILLGTRLAGSGGRSGLVRMVLMATGSAAAVFVLMTSFGLTRVVDGQDARAQHIAPRVTFGVDDEINATLIADSWDGRELSRVVLASDLEVPTPPGLERAPGDGEVMMSPALESLAGSEPLVAERFPQTRGPQIASDGLIAPDQLLAYIGAPAGQMGPFSAHIDSFGNPESTSRLDPRAALTIGMLITLLLIAPVIMFMAVCARLAANSRTQRLTALRLLGLNRRRTQIVNAAEIAITATTGSLIGWSLWRLWLALRPEARIGVFAWYSTDIELPITVQIAVICGLIAMSITVAVVASRNAIAHPSRTRRDRSSRHVSLWRLTPLMAGAAVLVIARLRTRGITSADFEGWVKLFGFGLTLVAIGLVIAAPLASALIGRTMMRSSRPPWLIAGSRLRHDPSATSRVVAALAVALFAAGVAQIVAVSLDKFDAENNYTIPPVVNLEVIGPPTTPATYRSLSPLGDPVSAIRIGAAGKEIDAVVATCAQLRTSSGLALPTCVDGQTQRIEPTGETAESSSGVSAAAIDAALSDADLPRSSETPVNLTIPFAGGYFTPSVIVPPDLAPPTATRFYVPIPAERYDPQLLTAALASQSATAFWNPQFTGIHRLDTPRIYRGLIAAGTVAALVIGAIALAISTIATSIENRSRLRSLDAIGANPSSIRRCIVLQTTPVSIGLLTIASTAAIVGGDAYIRVSYASAAFPTAALAALIGFSAAATAISSLLAAGAVTHLNHNEIVRQE